LLQNNGESQTVASAFLNQSVKYIVNDYHPKIQQCLEQLTDEQIWWRPNPSSNSIGNLVLHLCGNVRQWIISGLGNAADLRVRDTEFAQTEIIPREALVDLLNQTLAEVKEVLENLPAGVLLDQRKIQGRDVQVLEAVYHVIEHFSMHTGQIITLTKLLKESGLNFDDL
jgi:uncharacterized damage-inducible protein DinB